MKKFIILSGAYINAGDFLIVKRTEELLRYLYPNCDIVQYERNKDLTDKITEINKSDAVFIAGGPAYKPKMYPNTIRLVEDLSKIKTKIIPIGVGWYGSSIDNQYLYKYLFTSESKKLLDKISKDINMFSCRDWYSIKVLQINGYHNAIMTGCPAWYNIKTIDKTMIKNNNIFKKICISDPADSINFEDALNLIKYLKDKYKQSNIYFVFHRIDQNNNKYSKFISIIKSMDIKIIDITGSADGFKFYDDCDLHIGFRVHAHIYNLSNRNLSMLIEEDGRGTGVNEAIGLQGFKSTGYLSYKTYKNDFINRCFSVLSKKIKYKKKKKNLYLIKEIDNYLMYSKDNNYIQYEIAFKNMNNYFNKMIDYIKKSVEGE